MYEKMPPYSVLMSVYKREIAEYFIAAVESILHQTVPPQDFVIVCDGPLTEELNQAISHFQEQDPHLFQVIRIENNVGLGKALAQGLPACRFEYVARMDTDDLSRKDRCEKLLIEMEQRKCDIIGGAIAEFHETPGDYEMIRRVPLNHEEICSFAKRRNPFNHVSVLFKKSAVLAVGNYQEFLMLEDYYLWVRMIQNGARCSNLEDILVDVRVGNGMYERRANKDYVKAQREFFRYLKEVGFITSYNMFIGITERTLLAMVPNCIRKLLYRTILRQ